MYKTIVVGTDGSETATIAVERAGELARLTGARLHVVSSYHPARPQLAGRAPAGEFTIAPDFKADAVLGDAAGRLRADGVDVEEHGPKGDPADALVDIARREGADLIVMGSLGMQGARRVLGSVPNKVSHNAPCDVLIVQTT
jgi:nucleotide-binding universal stress UspA family protein